MRSCGGHHGQSQAELPLVVISVPSCFPSLPSEIRNVERSPSTRTMGKEVSFVPTPLLVDTLESDRSDLSYETRKTLSGIVEL